MGRRAKIPFNIQHSTFNIPRLLGLSRNLSTQTFVILPMRFRAVLAFLAFLVVEQLVEGGAAWIVFFKLKLLEASWKPSSFIVIEGITFAAVLAGSLVAARIQKKRLSNYGFAPAGAARQLAVGSV